MRLLLIHADSIEYQVKRKTRVAEPVDEGQKSDKMEEALAAFIAVEEVDAEDEEYVASRAVEAIIEDAEQLKTERVMLYPYARVLTIIPIFFFLRLVAVPAVFLLGFWFILQVISGAGSLGASGGVAWFAHIGGFVAGLVLVFPFRRRGVPVTLWNSLRRGRSYR